MSTVQSRSPETVVKEIRRKTRHFGNETVIYCKTV